MTKEHPAAIFSIDGGARGNPGPAACAVVVETADGKRVDAFSKHLGETTNNVAEYEGLLAALDYALRHDFTQVTVFSDSELLVRQVRGAYKVKSPSLKPLHQRAMEMISRLDTFAIRHIPREQNREADRLLNQALDRKENNVIHHRGTETQRTASEAKAEDSSAKARGEAAAHPAVREQPAPLPEQLNSISHAVVDAAFAVHSQLGPGLLEGVYEMCMVHELTKRGLAVERQVNVPIEYDGIKIDAALRIDMLVEKSVVVELKSVETLLAVHTAQVLTYLKLTGCCLGLLINFNVPLIRDGIKRLVR